MLAIGETARTDAQLIRDSLDDPEAFVTVFRRHYDAVRAYAYRRAGASLADEIASEAFTRAFAARARFRPLHDSALPWLYGITTNLLRDHWRTERRWLDHVAQLADEPAVAADGREAHADLLRRLADLPQIDREVLFLLAWADLSYQEIATALDVPVGTVRSRINRARRRLEERPGDTAERTPLP